jgi:hypothetical protein
MSEENVEIVRKPLRVRERSRRTLDQRHFLLSLPRPMRLRTAETVEAAI